MIICRGSYQLGSACGSCDRCDLEKTTLIRLGKWPVKTVQKIKQQNEVESRSLQAVLYIEKTNKRRTLDLRKGVKDECTYYRVDPTSFVSSVE